MAGPAQDLPVLLRRWLFTALALGVTAHARWLDPHSASRLARLDATAPADYLDAVDVPSMGPVPYVLFGDSHAGQYRDAMTERFGRGAMITDHGCLSAPGISNWKPGTTFATRCDAQVDALIRLVSARRPRAVLWAQRWDRDVFDPASGKDLGRTSGAAAPALLAAIDRLRARLPADVMLLLIGNSPTALASAPQMWGGYVRCRMYLNVSCPKAFPAKMAEGRTVSGLLREHAAGRPGLAYVDAAAPLCPDGVCRIIDHGRLDYWDGSHMTTDAARKVVATIDPALLH